MKRIYLASDHAGTLLKDQICEQLAKIGYEVKDLGANGSESVDYPDLRPVWQRLYFRMRGRKVFLFAAQVLAFRLPQTGFPIFAPP